MAPPRVRATADAEVVLDTTKYTPEEAAQLVFLELEKEGYVQ